MTEPRARTPRTDKRRRPKMSATLNPEHLAALAGAIRGGDWSGEIPDTFQELFFAAYELQQTAAITDVGKLRLSLRKVKR